MDKGFFVMPTLFVDVDNSMTIAQEEIFGPVLSVIPPFDDADDAVRIANDSPPYGLAGNVMAGSLDRALSVARRLRAGFIGLNGTAGYGADTPFGGYKASGVGRQKNGIAGFDQYTEIKSVAYLRIEESFAVTDFDVVDFFTDQSLVPDPYPYFDHLRAKCPVTPATGFNVLAVTGYDAALSVYRNPAFSSCVSVSGPFSGMPITPGESDDVSELIEKTRPPQCADVRTHRGARSTAAHPDTQPDEHTSHTQAPQRERRLHVAAGRSAAGHLPGQG